MRTGGETGNILSYQDAFGVTIPMPNAGIVLGACSRSLYKDEVTYTNWEITQTFKVYKETLPYLTISPNLFTSPDEHCGGHYNQTIEVLDGESVV